jgi:hypothetical protein
MCRVPCLSRNAQHLGCISSCSFDQDNKFVTLWLCRFRCMANDVPHSTEEKSFPTWLSHSPSGKAFFRTLNVSPSTHFLFPGDTQKDVHQAPARSLGLHWFFTALVSRLCIGQVDESWTSVSAEMCLLIICAHLYAAVNQQGTAILDDYHQRHFGGICDLTIAPAMIKVAKFCSGGRGWFCLLPAACSRVLNFYCI